MIAAVVLAAGASRRFGAPKLLLPIQGRPLVRLVVEQVLSSGVDAVHVVVGPVEAGVRQALQGLGGSIVRNPDFAEGMSTSLRTGVAALSDQTEAAIVVLADQPLHTPAVIDLLVETFRSSGRPIVAPVYNGTRGNPVLFAASLFPELLTVTGDRGAREVIARDPARVALVRFPFLPPPDIDTPEDYQRFSERSRA
jgi:molybdenum cofactor cytidylyltransferase